MGFGQIYLWGVISKRVVVVIIVVTIVVIIVVPKGVTVVLVVAVIVIIIIVIIISKRVIIIVLVIVAVVVVPTASVIIVVSWFTPTIFFHVTSFPAIITISIYLPFRSPITLVRPSLLVILLVPVVLSRWVCHIGLI